MSLHTDIWSALLAIDMVHKLERMDCTTQLQLPFHFRDKHPGETDHTRAYVSH
jgi:hypothetical protein